MKKIFFLASLISLACISCKAKKESAKATENTSSSSSTSNEKTMTYRLIVSFISKGAGTDATIRNAFTKYVENHPKKPAFKLTTWGREGEGDYCFTLSEIKDKKEEAAFVDGIKQIIGSSDMANISENAELKHKGR